MCVRTSRTGREEAVVVEFRYLKICVCMCVLKFY